MTTTPTTISVGQSIFLGRLLASVEGSTSAQRAFCLQHIQTKDGAGNIPFATSSNWIDRCKTTKRSTAAQVASATTFRAALADRLEGHIANGVGQEAHDAWAGTQTQKEAPAPAPRPEAKAVAAPVAQARRWRNVKANTEGQFVVAGIRVQVSKSGMNVQTFA
jgi:hypothetical protein